MTGRKRKKWLRRGTQVLLCAIFMMLISSEVTHAEEAGFLLKAFLDAVVTILYWIFQLMGRLMMAAMWMVDFMITTELNKLIVSKAVSTGWVLVRDFVNLFMVIILLFVAICTILRIEDYSAKKMLKNVLVAALLINFSKPISLFIIDISQLAMSFFASNLKSASGGSFSTKMMDLVGMAKIFDMDTTQQTVVWSGTVVIALLAGIIFMFIMTGMLFLLALGLVYRIVAFMVLIILSPFAFVGASLPGTPLEGAFRNWRDKMLNWAFFGPTMLFFMWLAVRVMTEAVAEMQSFSMEGATEGMLKGISSTNAVNVAHAASFEDNAKNVLTGMFQRIVPFVVAIYFLYYGFDTSKSMAGKVSKALGSMMDRGEGKISNWAKKVGVGSAIGAGTVGLVPAAFALNKLSGGRGTHAWNMAKAYGKGTRKHWLGDPDEKKKKRDEQLARIEADAAGGDAQRKYIRDKAREKVKSWGDGDAPTKEELDRLKQSGNSVERAAAQLYAAKEGKFETADDFGRALNEVTGDDKLQRQIRKDAEKKNLMQVLNYDINNNKEKLIEFGVESARKRSQREGIDWNDRVAKTVRDEYEKAYNDDKQQFKEMVYSDKLDTLSIGEIFEQNVDFQNSKELGRYMADEMGAKGRFTAGDIRKFVNKGKSDPIKAAIWEKRGFYTRKED